MSSKCPWKRRHRGRQCDHRGRDGSDVAIGQGVPAATRSQRRQGSGPPPTSEDGPANTLICDKFSKTHFGLGTSRTVR